jgi:hypothetical protein
MADHNTLEDAGLETLDLHRSNLLRMQIAELLDECQLDPDNMKWGREAEEFIQLISNLVSNIHVEEKCFQDQADKPISVDVLPSDCGLSVTPLGCTKSHFFMTKRSGNAQVLPTFELMVQMPESSLSGKDFMSYRYFDVSYTADLLR